MVNYMFKNETTEFLLRCLILFLQTVAMIGNIYLKKKPYSERRRLICSQLLFLLWFIPYDLIIHYTSYSISIFEWLMAFASILSAIPTKNNNIKGTS